MAHRDQVDELAEPLAVSLERLCSVAAEPKILGREFESTVVCLGVGDLAARFGAEEESKHK